MIVYSENRAAAEDGVSVIEDGRLAGRGGALGLVKEHGSGAVIKDRDLGRLLIVAVADAYGGAERLWRFIPGDPVQIGCGKLS